MKKSTSKLQMTWNSKNLFFMVLILQLTFLIFVLFDIPIARQTFVFLYLMFVPGFIFIRILCLNNMRKLEIALFSIGFSIAFLMLFGLLLNEIAPLVGISKPLAETPLMISLNSIVLLLCFFGSLKGEEPRFRIREQLNLIVRAPLSIMFVFLPFWSVLGTMWVNIFESNIILLFTIIVISMLFVCGVFVKKLLSPELYPLAILTIAVALLFHFSLLSNYVISGGSDILYEISVFKLTKNVERWNSMVYGRYNDMLSITILPTIFASLLNMETEWIFKILYPLIFSFVPLILYQLWRSYIGSKGALISVFLFMAQQTFYTEILGLARQMIAELFFSLLFLVVLDSKMNKSKKIICFLTFGAALILSHYAMAIIFLFLLFFAWIVFFVMKRGNVNISLYMIVLFCVLMFSWYIFTSGASTYRAIVEIMDHVYRELDEWANPSSRGTTVLRGLGMEPPPSILNAISRAFAYSIQFFIVLGFIGITTKQVKTFFDKEYLAFTSAAMALLVALIVVPALAETLRMTRFYHILLFFLAPLAIIGVDFLVKLTLKRKADIVAIVLIMIMLIPYFLFQTNFVYEITKSDSWSLPLSKYRMDKLRLYYKNQFIDEQSAFGAQWLLHKVDIENTQIYADMSSLTSVLVYYEISYKGQPTRAVFLLSNTTELQRGAAVYLNWLNVINGTMVDETYTWSLHEYPLLNSMSIIYSNGGSEILKTSRSAQGP